METLELDVIRLDGGTQPRGKLDESVVEDYAEKMKAGVEFPPVTVFYDGENYWLADGFHRVHARRKVVLACISADIRQGSQRDAQWHSFGANREHGLRRSAGDARRAIAAILQDPEWSQTPQSRIAAHVGVAPSYVTQVKATIKNLIVDSRSDTVVAGDGRTIHTARIGKSRPKRTPRANRGIPADAFTPVLGHSNPPPMVQLSLPRNNPEMAADTLLELFDSEWLAALAQRITARLQNPEQ